MRAPVKYLLAICLAGVFLFFALNVLFPIVYKIKEPCFAIPVEIDSASERGVLPIRNDAWGEGLFNAKRSGGRRHKGLDLRARIKSPVYASKSGWARSCDFPGGYGNLVIINHPGRWQTRYGHLDKSVIKGFQWVRQGEIIGFVGKTGNADLKGITPHLHFEIRYKGKPADPAPFLVKQR
ncbi:MAG: M23 family metallopeptidase [Candidatus Omnitrophota bacterium]